MSETVEPRLSRGLRDLLPEQMLPRQWMIDTVRGVYELYGFVPLQTPAIEFLDVLRGSAAGTEAQQSIFTVSNPEEEVLGLRFDLTVPLARVVAQYRDLPRPFRRYQVSPVWRADKPGPGRFREFTQFDLDSVGTLSEIADTEIIAGMCDSLAALKVDFKVRFSSRGILNLLLAYAGLAPERGVDVFRVLDKLDKVGIDKIKLELTKGYHDASGDFIPGLGLAMDQVERIERFLAIRSDDRNEVVGQLRDIFATVEGAEAEIATVEAISNHLYALGYGNEPVALDLSIARGLAYYTGPVFEAMLLDAPQFGSVFGGGRYDDLVMRFLGEKVPATGASMGVDRLLAALVHLGRAGQRKSTSKVLVTAMDASLKEEYLAITFELRRAGIAAEMYLGLEKGIGKQIKYADATGIPIVLLLGSTEKERGIVTLKDMEMGRRRAQKLDNRQEWLEERPGQREAPRADLVATVREMLGQIEGERPVTVAGAADPAHSASPVDLDGSSLSLEDLARVARDPRVQVTIGAPALSRVAATRDQIERLVHNYREDFAKLQRGEDAHPVLEYGVTTGFGEFKNIPVAPDHLEELQQNILLSHSVGAGENADADDPANYFEPEVVRAALLIRLNAFLKGHSGVRVDLVHAVERMLNRGVVPLVPIRGSVGSSGDLCPLSHLFVVLLGEGRYYLVREPADLRSSLRSPRELRSGLDALAEDLGMPVPKPSFKEGLALTNGANFSAGLLALAVHDAERLAHSADVAAALSLEAVCGCARALDPKVHEARGQAGQIASAANLRALLTGSRLLERAGAVQDVYSLRCAPAVHGAARDAIAYARRAAEAEVNAATDNPLFFGGADPWDYEFRANWPDGYRGDQRISYSAGNFHGEPVGLAADFLAIGLAELANISERRTQMLLDGHHNRHLPGNLIPRRGVNSGLMIAQYCAAGIVSENKVLTHPASVDSIPTSANSEDHNAMATHACRKLRTVLGNVQAVVAIELLVAAQAVDWRVAMEIDPVKGADVSEEDGVQPTAAIGEKWRRAEREAAEFAARTAPEKRPGIAARLGAGTKTAYLAVRQVVEPMLRDRTLDEDVRRVRALVEAGAFGSGRG